MTGHATSSSDREALERAEPPAWDGASPLAEAKLAAPRFRPEMVSRPRVTRRLDAVDGPTLRLVAAPPGYGKTIAVRAWCESRGEAFAWVTLDAGDNDPLRLWRYVAAAVDRVREGLGRTALQRLRVPGASVEPAIDALMNGIAAFGSELAIVLDDAHAVTAPDALASLDYALGHQVPQAKLVLVARRDPALALARLRAHGELAELRADELAFRADETAELLQRSGVSLAAPEVESLRLRTEGWPAALYLAALWLRELEDPARAVQGFGGGTRFVAEYLTREVLDTLDEDVRSLLLRASALGRFTPALCDAVLERSDTAERLAELERSNLFVVRLEHGDWFRIHSLFAEYASLQLEALEPDAKRLIHRRAAEWLAAHGVPVEAAEHAAAAGDHALVAGLLREYHLVLIRSGHAATLLRWVQTLPDTFVVEHPELAGAGATAATIIGGHALERRRLLHLADRAQRERPARVTPYAEAAAAMARASAVDDHVGRAVAEGARAVELAEAEADDVLVAALGGFARALYFAGRLEDAWRAALRAIEHPDAERRIPGHAFARSTLALAAAELGRPASARTHAEKAKRIVGAAASSRSWLGANAAVALGVVLEAEGKLAEAERELGHARPIFEDEVATVHQAWLLVRLARVRCRRGRLDEAAQTLAAAAEAIAELADCGTVAALADEVARELELTKARAGNGELLERPSDAELAVLQLLGSDLSARQIGGELFLSPNTVRTHMRALYRKLGVSSRADAVARAGALGLLARP